VRKILLDLVCFILLRVLFATTRIVPFSFLVRINTILAGMVSRFFSREKKITVLQLELCKKNNPKLQAIHSEKVFQGIFRHIGACFLEFPWATKISSSITNSPLQFIEETSSKKSISEIIGKNEPVMILSGHLGNFELLASYFANKIGALTVLARVPNYPYLADLLYQLRESNNVRCLWRGGKETTTGIIKTIKNNGMLSVLLDQDTEHEGQFVDFFGIPATHPIGALKFAIKYNLRVTTAFIVREGIGKHRIFFDEIESKKQDLQTEDSIRFILSSYSERLEKYISLHPEQWLWWHKRWRSQPNSKRKSSKEYIDWLRSSLVFCSFLIASCSSVDSYSLPEKPLQAQTLIKNGEIDQGIILYQEHMLERLKNPWRPDSENPYFYLILIGDAEKDRKNYEKAIEYYKEALSHRVADDLILSRMREVAFELFHTGQEDPAIELLQSFHKLDPLFIDGTIDELNKLKLEKLNQAIN